MEIQTVLDRSGAVVFQQTETLCGPGGAELLRRSARAKAHGRLLDWGQHRDADFEGVGWSPNSATERMRQRAHGGDSSTVPGRFTTVERDVIRVGRTMQTELAVRSLSAPLREVVVARYAEGRTLSVWAGERGLSPDAARKRASRALLEVGTLLTSWSAGPTALSAAAVLRKLHETVDSDVTSAQNCK